MNICAEVPIRRLCGWWCIHIGIERACDFNLIAQTSLYKCTLYVSYGRISGLQKASIVCLQERLIPNSNVPNNEIEQIKRSDHTSRRWLIELTSRAHHWQKNHWNWLWDSEHEAKHYLAQQPFIYNMRCNQKYVMWTQVAQTYTDMHIARAIVHYS